MPWGVPPSSESKISLVVVEYGRPEWIVPNSLRPYTPSMTTAPSTGPRVAQRLLFLTLVLSILSSVLFFFTRVDLTPRVESDFFFSAEDPALKESREISRLFPTAEQIVLSIETPELFSAETVERVRDLSAEILAMPSVSTVVSLTSGPKSPQDVQVSPLWSRVLLGNTPNTTLLVAEIEADGTPNATFVDNLEGILAVHQAPDFHLRLSGVPYVIEKIRAALHRDLKVFSTASILLFGLIILVLYRSVPLVLGTLLSCVAACLLTLTILTLVHVPIGLLTANLVTIVFVLTLSHTVFLTSNWRRIGRGVRENRSAPQLEDSSLITSEAVRVTFTASFWCMLAALLGFLSLLLAHAKPLQELGISGATGTLVAITVAYGVYPAFLRFTSMPNTGKPQAQPQTAPPSSTVLGWTGVLLLGVLGLAGLSNLQSDPPLLAYFAPQSTLRRGLESIDSAVGSSPLHLVVSRPDGSTLDSTSARQDLATLQAALDEDPAVGTALSLAVLVAEAQRNPLARLLPQARLIQLLESKRYDEVAKRFLTEDHQQTMFTLSMKEAQRSESRERIITRLSESVETSGFQVDRVGGLFDLQRQLGTLVRTSLGRELGGLLFCFVIVAWIVSRSLRTTLAMSLCLALLPIILLSAIALLGVPLDIISSPAINVAIALGIDAMIHWATAVRRFQKADGNDPNPWSKARAQQLPAIVSAMAILATGFTIFLLSSFPPTQRFGGLVAAGMLLSAVFALQILPWIASTRPTS